jgi:hypothetical protein
LKLSVRLTELTLKKWAKNQEQEILCTKRLQLYRLDAAITLSGTVYYRIKQIDFNNSFEYSKMVAVDLSGSATVKGVESVYPNPFNNYVTLQISTTAEEKVPYTITDQFGKVVYSGLVSVTSGTGVYSIDGLNSLAQGVYIISINGKAFSSQHKVTKF